MDARVKQVPGYSVDRLGKPQIGSDPAALYGFGHFIRITERLILDLFGRGLLSGTTHTCLGQEICQMSVVRALNHPDDAVFSNHRNHGHYLTYTGDALGLVAEIMGREAGVCRGYGGSQHIAHRRFHSNGVQAGMTGIAVGHALDLLKRSSDGVVAVMIGDGTLGEGLLYESMNLAAVWGCSVLFVVEHNGIAQTTSTSRTVAGSAQGRGEAFGLRTWRVDDASPDFVTAVEGVVSQMRGQKGPGLLVIDTKRMGPHSKGDDLREPQELQAIADRDPLAALGRRLDPTLRASIEERNTQFLKTVEEVALDSPESRFSVPPAHALRDASPAGAAAAQPAEATNVRAALNAALRTLLAHSDDVMLLGEDMHEPYGGAFKVTAGLSSEFSERVISTPISEAGITGAGIGLAMAGRRPIVEIMFADFLTLCMDQIYNHAVKFPGMFADCDVPLVVRSPSGGRRGYGPTHSQSPENLMVSVPGLTVLFGSHRHNVGQLLVDAVTRWPNPVVFLEHKLLYGEKQHPGGYEVVPPEPLDPGAMLFPTLRRGGTRPDVTLIGFGGMLPVLERAAEMLERDEELSVEIVAPSLLSPLPRRTLVNLLRDRPRIAFVEESHHEYGVSAELLATLAEAGFRGRALRLGTAPVPIASARSLERDQLHNEQSIIRRVLEMF